MFGKTSLPNENEIGSPMKKQRATTFSSTPEEAKALLKDITGPSPLGSVTNSSDNALFGPPITGNSITAGSLPNQVVKDEAMDEEEL